MGKVYKQGGTYYSSQGERKQTYVVYGGMDFPNNLYAASATFSLSRPEEFAPTTNQQAGYDIKYSGIINGGTSPECTVRPDGTIVFNANDYMRFEFYIKRIYFSYVIER